MLEIKTVQWRNFMSYGDYDTSLDIENLGQCLITGEVVGDNKSVYDQVDSTIKKSNGAGKSTIPNVILWTLFGRTMHSNNPGDKVVNWFTGENCRCKITFKNGDYIIRTRKSDGKNELIFVKDGDETCLAADTLSTLKNQQRQLNQLFNLDWELLCGSMFFNQYSKPWMEMADSTRKKAIERALHVDRFEYRAKVAKDKKDAIERKVEDKKRSVEEHQRELQRLDDQIERVKQSLIDFDTSRDQRKQQALADALEAKRNRDSLVKPDIDKLTAKWDIVKKVKLRIGEMRDQANELSSKIAMLEGSALSDQNKIDLWRSKSGKVCSACEQDITDQHTISKIEPYEISLEQLNTQIEQLNGQLSILNDKISVTKQLLMDKTPDLTLDDARSILRKWDSYDQDIVKYEQLAAKIDTEVNPHQKTIDETEQLKIKLLDQIATLNKEVESFDYLNRHYQYVYKAWSDRTKIKSFIFKEHIPFINERLKHYLNVFGLDINIELTSALGINSNMWGYEFESGGERKRTDVAFMLSMFDFHEQMYGRQSNVLVLDEVDGRLDDDGIDSLINIIKNDLSNKVESVLIISHRNMMHDTFARELQVKREGSEDFRGFSKLVVI